MAVTARTIETMTFRFRATLVIVFLWGLSLITPALSTRYDAGGNAHLLLGYQVLTSGWLGLAALQLGWLANPLLALLLVVWNLSRTPPRSIRAIAVLLLVASLWTVDLPLRPEYYHHEGFGVGYWLWMVANAAAVGVGWATTRDMEPLR